MENKYRENISAEQIRELDLSWFKGEIIVVDNFRKFNSALPRLLNSNILGFDTETKPSFRKGRNNRVSLIQLADNDIACLFRINKIGIPDKLASILSDPWNY